MARLLAQLLKLPLCFSCCLLLLAQLFACQPESVPLSVAETPVVPIPTSPVVTQTRTNINIIAETPPPSPVASDPATIELQPVPSLSPTPSPSAVPSPQAIATASPVFVSRSDSSGSSGQSSVVIATPLPVTVSAVQIASVAPAQLQRGKTLQLYGQVKLSDGSKNQALGWHSSAPNLATVSASGLVTALKPGNVTVYATATADNTKQAQLSLQITQPVIHFTGQIVYVANNDVYLMKGSNAQPQRLTFTDDRVKRGPRLSWRGDQVVYGMPSFDLETVATSGATPPVFHDLPHTDIAQDPYYWFNDEIIYQTYDDVNPALFNLYRLKPDGSVQGFSNYLGRIGQIAGITPTGIVVYEQSDNGIRIRSSKYNDVSTRVEYGFGNNPKIAMNPNPSLIVYWQDFDIYSSKFTGDRVNLTPQTEGSLEYHPAISPDERKILFVSNREGGQADIFMMDADGSHVVNLTNTPDISENHPDWGL